MKKLMKFILGGGAVIIVAAGVALHTNAIKLPITRESQPSYAGNFADDKILMGASHNIFVGKIIAQVGNKHRKSGPETQFAVEVILNIKGNLSGRVVVDQFGGYENGILYTVDGGLPAQKNNNDPYLLQPGSTYLLATRYNKDENWYTLNSFATARKLLSRDEKLNGVEIASLSNGDERVRQLQSAYPNEVVLKADADRGNAKNAYQFRKFDVAGNVLDDTVVLHEQYLAAHPSISSEPAASPAPAANTPGSEPAESVEPSVAPTLATEPTAEPTLTPEPTATPAPEITLTPAPELTPTPEPTIESTPEPTAS
jgi:hypothetical protein